MVTLEPLYKGQVVQWSLSTRDKLYSGASLQGTSCTVEPLYKVVLFLEVTNIPSLWKVGEVVLFSEVTNVQSLWEVEIFRRVHYRRFKYMNIRLTY